MRTYTKVFNQMYEFSEWLNRNKYNQLLIMEVTHRCGADGLTIIQLTYTSFTEWF